MNLYPITVGAIIGVMLAWLAISVTDLHRQQKPIDYALVNSVSWELQGRVVIH